MPLGLATIGFKLLGIGQALGRAVKAGVRWVLSDWRHVLIVALVASVGFLWLSNAKWQGRAEKALATVEQRDKTIAAMKAASEVARAAQIAMNKAVTDKQIQIERLNREKANLNAIAIRDASARYADNNRLSKVCPAYSSGTNTAAENRVAEGDDGLSETSIVVSTGDFELLNDLAKAGINAGNWARDQVTAGLAEEAD
jgi:hypothetical protein